MKPPYQPGDSVVYGKYDCVTEVVECEYIKSYREWNLTLRNRNTGGVFWLPVNYVISLKDYLKARTLKGGKYAECI